MIVTPVYDDSESVELSAIYHLYLKPKAKLIMSIILPEETELSRPLSNWDIMEELKNLVAPDTFSSLRISKTTKEFIRIEGETDTKCLTYRFLEKLNGQSLTMGCLPKPLDMVVSEAPADLTVNDNIKKLLTELENLEDNTENNKPPPCIYLEGLPCKWFLPLESNTEKPSEEVLRSTFEKFGNIMNIDIPMLDPYREDSNGNQLGPGGPFDAFLQYEKLSSAVDALRSLQGMKLMFTAEDGKSVACDIKISINETNHFSEEAISKRTAERLKLQELEQQRKQEKEEEEAAERKRKLEERKARSRKRRARLKRKLQRQKLKEQKELQQQEKCPEEEEDTQEWQERKLVLAQRRLESIQLLTAILDKVNDLVQVNKLEEEQMNCEFAGLSDCSVSTYSENSKVMSLSFSDEEEIVQHETEACPEDKVQIIISHNDNNTDKHGQKQDPKVENNFQKLADDEAYLEDDTCKEQKKQITFCSQRIFKLSQNDPINRSSVKKKIYETDEFINYLLNYYHYPEYARLFLETKETASTPRCRRVVRWKGNSFQIKLQNLNGHFAEMNFMPELEEETEDDSLEWNAPVEQSEEKSQVFLDRRKDPSESYRDLAEDELEVPVSKATKPRLVKSSERSYKKTWDDEVDSLSSVPNSEIKEVLEEISSTSEYFSEDLSECSSRQMNIRRISRKQRRIKQLKKLKHHNVPGHPQLYQHEDILDHLLHSYCHRLKKHSKYKMTNTHRKKPAFQYDSETTESESDTEAHFRAAWKRKRSKLKNRICLLEEKKVNKEMYSSSESESSSSPPHQPKVTIMRHHPSGKPKRKVHKTGGSDSNEKPVRKWDYCLAEDVSDSLEHEESTWEAEETQTKCSISSSQKITENKQLGGRAKNSYSDYWEWEHHFYKEDKSKN
ncbi:A-kinase anchor protein 17B-like [Engystomops pustulosus]|uniref:A-kinase anchor protein 17B-like n=1 Tax=Engystomops pustulosus TaxID=76066 RepID=UPI003AFB6E21